VLIINADDFGRSRCATDRISMCFENKRITTASAMVFMEDSERAATLAIANNMEIGLHLNFTEKFTGSVHDDKMVHCHKRICNFLTKNKYFQLLYNPFLRQDFKYSFKKQFEEYVHLYGKQPSHINGHHHMHICMNMLIQKIIPQGQKIRRNCSFVGKQKSFLNRLFRMLSNSILSRRYILPDYYFFLSHCIAQGNFQQVVDLARTRNVEVGTHPEVTEEYQWLMDKSCIIAGLSTLKGSYSQL
jgi:chitin disaccharide deacetylase